MCAMGSRAEITVAHRVGPPNASSGRELRSTFPENQETNSAFKISEITAGKIAPAEPNGYAADALSEA
jgi:hypothetical protein